MTLMKATGETISLEEVVSILMLASMMKCSGEASRYSTMATIIAAEEQPEDADGEPGTLGVRIITQRVRTTAKSGDVMFQTGSEDTRVAFTGRLQKEITTVKSGDVIADTGAGDNMFQMRSGNQYVTNSVPTNTQIRVAKAGAGGLITGVRRGDVKIKVMTAVEGKEFAVTDMTGLEASELGSNLGSISKAVEADYEAHFLKKGGDDVSYLLSPANKNTGRREVIPLLRKAGTWVYPTQSEENATLVKDWISAASKTDILSEVKNTRNTNRPDRGINSMLHAFGADAEDVGSKSMLQHWHEVMGHLNFADLVTLASMTPGMPDLSKEKRYKCHCCMQAKALRKGHPKQARHRATKKMERLHIDFSGPFQIPSIGGARYLFVIVDDYSRNVAVYLT